MIKDLFVLKVLNNIELFRERKPLKVCTFSRVMKEKGVEIAVNAVRTINDQIGYTAYKLDIYGKVDYNQRQWFDELEKSFPSYIEYKGIVKYDETTDILKCYYLLLFPTYYDGECFAGTIIDAMSAGLPIIASYWKYNSEIIHDGINGFLCEPKDVLSITRLLYELLDTGKVNMMKQRILKIAQNYRPMNVLSALFQRMEE